MQLTIGWKTACTSQDIPADKEPGGSKLKRKPECVMNQIMVIKLDTSLIQGYVKLD